MGQTVVLLVLAALCVGAARQCFTLRTSARGRGDTALATRMRTLGQASLVGAVIAVGLVVERHWP